MKKFFYDKRIVFVYIITILILLIGTSYALSTASQSLGITTSLIGIDEDAYGSTEFDSSNLDFKPILDTKVEESTDNVIKIDFSVGGARSNVNENIIYDVALNDLDINCNLLSPYIKWKLLKEGIEVSSGSLDYKFDTIDEDGRLVLTTIQENLPEYNPDDISTYDDYTFYMWFSDSCQSEDISTCKSAVDQSNLIGQNIEGKIEVELYTEGKKQLVRNPENVLSRSKCTGAYIATLNTNGGVLASGVESSIKVISGSNWDPTSLPEPSRTDTVIFNTNGGSDITTVSNGINNFEIENTINTLSNIPKIKLMESSNNLIEISYDFVGWYLDKNLTIPVTSDVKVSNKNQKLYAKWSGDNTITLPSVTKDKNEFLGWYSDSSLKNKVGDAGDSYQVIKNTNLYAGWYQRYIQITLSDNGGTGGIGTIYSLPGKGFFSDMELTNPITKVTVPTKTGHTFTGYTGLTDNEGNITVSSDSIIEETTFTAGWSINSYNVNYNSGNLLFGINDMETVKSSNINYSISNGVFTVTALANDGHGYTTGRVYLNAGTTYTFNCTTSGIWGVGTEDTVEAFIMKDGVSAADLPHFRLVPGNSFTATVSGMYWLRLDVNMSGKTHTFSNLSITTVVSTKTLEYDSTLGTLPTANNPGYTFSGWYTGENGTGIQATTSTIVPANNLNYYAKWTANSYTVVADPNGGTIPTTTGWSAVTGKSTYTKSVTYGSTYGTLPTPTRTGYTFNGWYSVQDFGNVSIADASINYNYNNLLYNIYPGATYTIKMTSATLTAGTATQFSTLIYDFTSSTALASVNNSFGNGLEYSITCPSTADATHDIRIIVYAGINGSTSGNATTYSAVKIGSPAYVTINSSVVVSTPNSHVLFAKWTAKTITIDYYENGGTGTMDNSTYTYGSTVKLSANTFTKTGNTFTGWVMKYNGNFYGCTSGTTCDESNSTLGWYSSSGSALASYYKISNEADFGWPVDGGTIFLYAQWTAKTITITYNANGGTGSMASTTYTYGGTNPTPSANTFTKTGSTYKHWMMYRPSDGKYFGCTDTSVGCTSGAGNTTIGWHSSSEIKAYYPLTTWAISSTISDSDMIFYAYWDANTYTINYYNGTTKLGSSTHSYTTAKTLTTWSSLGGSVSNSSYGWSFAGWSTSNANTTRSYTNGQSVTGLTSTNGGTVNLYAVYSRTITFKSGVSNATSSTATQYWNPYGSTNGTHLAGVTSPALTTITNWTSLGFRNDTTASSKEYNASATIYPAVSEASTLYGVYSRTLTIAYQANGGSGSTNSTTKTIYLSSNSTTTTSQAVTLSANNFTYDGYAFHKWAAGSTGGTQYAGSVSYTAGLAYNATSFTVNMYAIWIEKVYEVSSVNSGYNTYQATLANAVTAAATGATIKVLKAKTDSSTVTISKNLTLNTNGKVLTRTGQITLSGGTLTINGSGTLTRGTPTTCQYLIYMSGGYLSVGAVTINDADTSTCATPLIENGGAGSITVGTSGSVTSTRNTLKSTAGGAINISGGTVGGTGDYNTIYLSSTATGTVTVSSGSITHSAATDYALYTASGSTAKINITGGTVSGTYYSVHVGGGTFSMSGGTVKTTTTSTSGSYQCLRILEGATATITGGTVQVSSASRAIYSSGTLTINGTGVLIYSANSTSGVSLRIDGANAILYFAAGKAQSTGNYGLYVLNSGKAYVNYNTASGKGDSYTNTNGAFISSISAHAVYGSTSASIYLGNKTYGGPEYAPTALVGDASKYAFACTSGVTICDWRGGRLFSNELYMEKNDNITTFSDVAILYTEYSAKTWNGAVSGYGLVYNARAYYDA